MTGHNYGAKQYSRIRTIYSTGLLISAGLMLIVGIVVSLAPELFAAVFARSPQVLSCSSDALRILAPGYLFGGVFLCTVSSFNGLGLGKYQLYATLLRLFVLVLPLAFLGSRFWNLNGVWSGMLLANLIHAIVMLLWFRSLFNKKLVKGKIVTL